jgi:hypothetical protein
MVIKIGSTLSFGWEVKPEASCCKILQHVKEPCVAWWSCYVSKIQGHFSPHFWVTARCLWCSQRELVNESGVLELRWGCTIGQKMAAVLGTLCSAPPSKSKKVKQSCYMPLEALGGGRYSSYSFTPRHYMGASGQCHAPAALYPWGKDPGTYWIGSPGHTVHSQTLCWLSNSSSLHPATVTSKYHALTSTTWIQS